MTPPSSSTPRVAALVTSSGRLLLLRHRGEGETFFRLVPIPARPAEIIRFVRVMLGGEISSLRQIAVVGGEHRVEVWTARLVGRASGRWTWLQPDADVGLGEVVERLVTEDELAGLDLRPETVKQLLSELAQSKLTMESHLAAQQPPTWASLTSGTADSSEETPPSDSSGRS